MPNIHANDKKLSEAELMDLISAFGPKIAWFMQNGYKPHYYQLMFHTMQTGDKTTRFRHLVAGRRGGKTLSAIYEVLYYCTHPEAYWKDFHNIDNKSDPLWVWVLAKDYKVGTAARVGIRNALRDSGLEYGKDYREHKTERYIEFLKDGTFLEFKTADDPESLRGAGLHILWIDEAAFIQDARAWNVTSPALSDKMGAVITTTTPDGKNWFYDEWWSDTSQADSNVGRIEYTSLDNPYFPKEEWDYQLRKSHPMQFKKEFMASFDSMAGKDLHGDWLQYYDPSDIRDKKFRTYIGIDPAISIADTADNFSMTLLGVEEGTNDAFILDQYNGHIDFPTQVQMIQEWHIKYRPMLIGIESTAYQAALAQQVSRLSSIPPVIEVQAKGKKFERILGMAPYFKSGRIKIPRNLTQFINEWVDYNSELKNPKDDSLDSCEIAIRTAGVLLPELYEIPETKEAFGLQDIVDRQLASIGDHRVKIDTELGSEW